MRERAATIMDIAAFFRSSGAQADRCKIGAPGRIAPPLPVTPCVIASVARRLGSR
jgi:hypothetical protein